MYPQHCKAIHINLCFAQPSLTNPWHVAQIINAKLPIANWFPLAISYQASVLKLVQTCHMCFALPDLSHRLERVLIFMHVDFGHDSVSHTYRIRIS